MRRMVCSLVILVLVNAQMLAAESDENKYVIGAGDVLQLNVWQVPSLDRQLNVRPDGMVVLPLAGELKAAGLSVRELQDRIVDRLRDYNRNVTEVSVSVSEYRSRSIYVLGRVLKPGKYSYAEPINLFDLIREAGGFAEDASRARVKVVHRKGKDETIEYANVDLALNTGTLESLPKVKAGDTVIVPQRGGGYAGAEGVQLIGAVRSPSIYPIEEVNDLVGIMLLAGGPTDQANLKKIKLVRRDAEHGRIAHEVNVKDYLEKGQLAANPKIEPGDTVYVPKRPQGWYRILRTFSLLIGTIGSAWGLYFALAK